MFPAFFGRSWTQASFIRVSQSAVTTLRYAKERARGRSAGSAPSLGEANSDNSLGVAGEFHFRHNRSGDVDEIDVSNVVCREAQMSQPEQDDGSLVILVRVQNEIEARAISAALEAAEIHVAMTGNFTANFLAEAPGDIQLRVWKSDLARAQDVLTQFRESDNDIDWDAIDVGTPETD